ncbi:hypothetical protein C8Q74DRAFT_1435957 [Fomes fomentarius]|nr:hypothetical protein C8Q74DRAFT_1435957 [Fomes fomentarius]
MYYTTYAARLALALFTTSTAARASPLAGESTSNASTLPVSDIVLTPVAANFTSAAARNSVRPDATVPSILLTCAGVGCTGSCSRTPLPTTFEVCLGEVAFSSVAVTQQFNEALPYGVFVGPPGCASFAQIPTINTCFNLNGGPFTDFELTFCTRRRELRSTFWVGSKKDRT